MNNTPQIPPWLESQDAEDSYEFLKVLEFHNLATAFSREYGIDLGLAIASLMAGAAHSLGAAVCINTTLGFLDPPFSLLLVTPERDPVWTGVPIRLLTGDLAPSFHPHTRTSNTSRGQGNATTDKKVLPSHKNLSADPKNESNATGEAYAKFISERITSGALKPPFARLPMDHHLTLTTPPTGLLRGFRQLALEDKIRIENALCSKSPIIFSNDFLPSAVPSFYWSIPRNDLAKFLGENPWFVDVPFLMLESECPGNPVLDPNRGCLGTIVRQNLALFLHRHHAQSSGRCVVADSDCFTPVRHFLRRGQEWEAKVDQKSQISARMVAELALRFAMVFALIEGGPALDGNAVNCGLALAKKLALRHCRTLSVHTPNSSGQPEATPDPSGLGARERSVYLRICERPGMTLSELGRSFNRMSKDERDRIVAVLVGRNLVRLEACRLWQVRAAV